MECMRPAISDARSMTGVLGRIWGTSCFAHDVVASLVDEAGVLPAWQHRLPIMLCEPPYGHQVQQCAARSSCIRRAASESQRPSAGTGRECRKAAYFNRFTAALYARAAAPRWHAGCAARGNQFTRRWAHAPPRTLAETPDQRHGAEQQPCDRWRSIVVTAEPARFSVVARRATSVGVSGC